MKTKDEAIFFQLFCTLLYTGEMEILTFYAFFLSQWNYSIQFETIPQ